MGDPIKKVDLDNILRKKVEESQFSFSEEHWNKLSGDLAKQNAKKPAFNGIVLLLQNRWVQSGLVAAVAVFATYLFMTNFSSDAVKQTPSAQNTPQTEINKTETPSSINESTPLTSENNDVNIINENNVSKTPDNLQDVSKSKLPPANGGTSNGGDDKNINNSVPVINNKKQDDEQPNSSPIKPIENDVRKPLLALDKLDLEDIKEMPSDNIKVPPTIIENKELEDFYATNAPDSTNNKADEFKVFALNGIGIKSGLSIAPTYAGSQQSTARGTTFGFFSEFSLTPKFSLQAEVLFTQVKGHRISRTETIGETVYTDNGTSSYNYTEHFVEINGLNYFRFPVFVKYKLSDKFSIGAGAYYSRLESPLGNETELTYNDVPTKTAADDYINTYGGPQTVVSSSAPDVSQSYSSGGIATQNSGLRNYDAGLVFDAEYRLKRWSLGARINQGVTDITPDDIYSNNKVHKTNTSTEITIGFLF